MESTRSRGDRYALSALRNTRASLASELVQLKRQLRHKKEALGHADATLHETLLRQSVGGPDLAARESSDVPPRITR